MKSISEPEPLKIVKNVSKKITCCSSYFNISKFGFMVNNFMVNSAVVYYQLE